MDHGDIKRMESDLKKITLIQFIIATIISLLFQFVIPVEWQPLMGALPPGSEGENVVFFTISQWFFSLSVAWLFYRDNKYLNNFLIFSFIPTSMMLVDEFIFIGLYYDWYHLYPFIVDIFILWKKRDTLNQKTFLKFIIIFALWLSIGYFMKLIYYGASFIEYLLRCLITLGLEIGFSFIFRKKKEDLINLPTTERAEI